MADIINLIIVSAQTMDSKPKNIKTYRFEFSKAFINELSRFSKVHQYDERHTYKKEWAAWKSNPEIAEVMEMEKRRLEENGYVGDIEDKMFKSGRYYFRKKTTAASTLMNATTSIPSTPTPLEAEEAHDDEAHDDEAHDDEEPQTPSASTSTSTSTGGEATFTAKHRKPYITMSKPCIRMMDAHIKTHSAKSNFKPSLCYDNFYNEKMSSAEMALEIDKIIEKYENVRRSRIIATDTQTQTVDEITNEIMDKIKKTYKNRYYRFVNNSNHKDDNDDE
jgi:hypothetical protein